MITVMRKHHKVLMIIITVLVCISFSWYWNKTDFAQMGDAAAGKLYDRDVSQVEYQRNARLLRLASQLGMRDMVQDLTLGAQSENEAFERFSWNLMVLRHEADQLGIKPTTTEIAAAVKSLPAFNGEKGFDLTAYTQFADHVLGSIGFSEAQIEELAGDQIKLDRVKKLLSTGVAIPEAEMRKGYEEAYARMDVSVVRFRFDDLTKDVQPGEEEIAKYFEAQKDQLKTDEKRKVKVVEFSLTEKQKKLTGKPRIDVLQKLADEANDFTDALQAPGGDFEKAVAKFNLTPKETGEFTQEKPDPLLAGTPALVQAAFSLMKEAPNSDAIQAADGFMVLHLLNIEPARPLTLEEARPKTVEALKKQGVRTIVAARASDVAQKLRDAIQSGKAVDAAATETGVKAEKLPAFALVDTLPGETPAPKPEAKEEAPDMPYIKQAASKLEPKTVSDYVGTPQGGLLVVLEKRETLGPAEFEKARGALEKQALNSKGQVVFYEWLREQRRVAGIQEKAPTAPG